MTSAPQINIENIEQIPQEQPEKSLKQHVSESMQRYFNDLDGQPTTDLYNIVMAEIEPPLLSAVMAYNGQNQSKSAEMLGLNRGTLRKKLKQYDLL